MFNAMKRARTYIVGVVIWASIFLFGVLRAFADSYTVNVVTYTQSENFLGIDAAGDFVVNLTNSLMSPEGSCDGIKKVSGCYETFYAGQQEPVFSIQPPTLAWDNGSACTVGTLSGVCNGEYELLGGYLNDVKGVWAGTDGSLSEILPGGSFDGGYINALGDAVFINGSQDELISVMRSPGTLVLGAAPLIAVQQPVPESASVWLVGLGMMGAALLVMKQRWRGRAEVRIPRKERGW